MSFNHRKNYCRSHNESRLRCLTTSTVQWLKSRKESSWQRSIMEILHENINTCMSMTSYRPATWLLFYDWDTKPFEYLYLFLVRRSKNWQNFSIGFQTWLSNPELSSICKTRWWEYLRLSVCPFVPSVPPPSLPASRALFPEQAQYSAKLRPKILNRVWLYITRQFNTIW